MQIVIDDKCAPNTAYHLLLAYNQQRLTEIMSMPLVQFLQEPDAITPEKAKVFLNCIQLFSKTFQKMIVARQATCNDPLFVDNFFEHFQQEFGHDQLLENREDKQAMNDSFLIGVLSWFPYQMFLVDNVGKAALVYLVWEVLGDHFHSLAKPLTHYTASNYFELHEEHDESHAEMGMDLLKHQSVCVYQTLLKLLEEAWDMFAAAFERVMILIECCSSEMSGPISTIQGASKVSELSLAVGE